MDRVTCVLGDEISKSIQTIHKLAEALVKLDREKASTSLTLDTINEVKQQISASVHGLLHIDSLLTVSDPKSISTVSTVSGASGDVLEKMRECYHTLLESVNEDPRREGLLKTPNRAAKAFLELTEGYRQDLKKLINDALYQSESDGIVIIKDIEFYSLCEHHLLPFMGKVHVGYIPKGKVIGLSKIPRIVDFYARRLQIQENLTAQIAKCIEEVTGAAGVTVVIEADHMCMRMRGVSKTNTTTKTMFTVGVMRDDKKVRSECLELLLAKN